MRMKKNGRRNGGGGGGGGGGGRSLQLALRRRVESCISSYSSAEEIVNHLRSTYPDYQRTKYQTLIRFVEDALQSINNTPTRNRDDDEDDCQTASRKKLKNIDEAEEKLQNIEELHIRRRMSTKDSSTSSSSASDDDGGVSASVSTSTSDDAVYGEKFEPAFDLMKTMLRNSYTGTKDVPIAKDKNVEMETVNSSKATIAVNVDGGEVKSATAKAVTSKQFKSAASNVGGGVEVKRKESVRFKDLGGMNELLEELTMEVMVPLCNPELPRHLGVRPITGILLHGPPGCGKTRLAHAIANEAALPLYSISATEVVSGVSGESEANIRDLFSKARKSAPSIVFIDEIDAIASKRENLQREMEKRIVTQLLTCMDQSDELLQPAEDSGGSDKPPGYVLVIGATNRPDAIDPALRRPGRFDREFEVGIPNESAREEILSVLTRKLKLDGSIDLRKIARLTGGFVGADLSALASKAGNLAMKRIIYEFRRKLSQDPMRDHTKEWWREPLPPEAINDAIKMSDFEEAAKIVQPSSKREGFTSIPEVKWEDVGGLDDIRHQFNRYIIRRVKYPEAYEGLGMDLETGFLLYGPPGCGKTLIAKAVANEAGANFMHVKGPELLNKYVGESELAVRTLFRRARTCAPCVLFFDEVDALTTKRGKEGGWVTERLLNQLLIELDGAEQRRGVFVIGATNRPQVIDRAILRPGRLGKLLHVPLPSPEDRVLILKTIARNTNLDASVDLSTIGRMKACENLSGADLKSLMSEATEIAVDEKTASIETARDSPIETARDSPTIIKTSHIEVALSKISPSVTEREKEFYQRWSESLKTVA